MHTECRIMIRLNPEVKLSSHDYVIIKQTIKRTGTGTPSRWPTRRSRNWKCEKDRSLQHSCVKIATTNVDRDAPDRSTIWCISLLTVTHGSTWPTSSRIVFEEGRGQRNVLGRRTLTEDNVNKNSGSCWHTNFGQLSPENKLHALSILRRQTMLYPSRIISWCSEGQVRKNYYSTWEHRGDSRR